MITVERPAGLVRRRNPYAGRLALALALPLLAAGCASDPDPVHPEGGALTAAAAPPPAAEPRAAFEPSAEDLLRLRDAYVASTAEHAMAQMIVRECPIFSIDADAVAQAKDRLALDTARTYGYDAQAIIASPLSKRVRNSQADPELRSLVGAKMAERSKINDLNPDNPESICSAGHFEMDENSAIGKLLKLE